MGKIKVGDKVRILSVNSPVKVYDCKVGDIVEVVEVGLTYGDIKFINNNGCPQVTVLQQVELVEEPYFKIGDKVRLIDIDYPNRIYGYSIGDIVEIVDIDPYNVIITNHIRPSQIIKPNQLEPLEVTEKEVEVVDEIGYNIVTGLHFGSSDPYSWLCDRELYNNIKLNDLVLVETKLGEQVVQVVKKSEVLDRKNIHKKVIKKLEITSK